MKPETLDQDAVTLAKAIRQTESNGNFTARGKSGEYGAYQFTQPTWDKTSKKYGINVPLEQATPEQQNEVAYKQIKEWKDQKYNPGQIASMWNSGKPDAYLDTEYKGKNKYGVTYDVPAYAKSVATAYQTLKQGGQVQADPQNPSSTANTTPIDPAAVVPEKKEGGLINQVYNSVAAPLVGLAAAPVQALAKGLGQEDPYKQGVPSLGNENTPVSKLGVKEKLGDAAQVASYVAPAKGLGGFIASGALQAGGAQASKGADAKDILKAGTIGGLITGGLGVAGKVISKIGESLPTRLVRSFIPKINEKTTEHALLTKKLGSYESVLKQTDEAIESLGNQLDTALNNPKYANMKAQGNDVMSQVALSLQDAGLTADDIANNLKRVAPMKAGLIDKFRKGSLTLKELHSLNSEIGKNVYKTVFDDPVMKANKDIGNAFYHITSDYIKKTAPETVPLFDDFSKELPLRAGLQKAMNASDKSRPITVADLVTFGIGSIANPMAAIGMVGAKKAFQSPTVNLKTAGLLRKGASETAKKVGQIGVPIGAAVVNGLLPKKEQKP